jgi:hypothetical protein
MPSVTVIVFSVLIAAAHTARAQDANIVADAIRHIQNDDPDPAPENRLKYVNIIEHERAVEAIPVLEGYYNRTTDADIKAEVAFALLRLGDKKNIYQEYVAGDAIKRVQSNNLGVGPVDALSYVDRILYTGATEGISALEDYFKRATGPDIKAGVASALVRMGDNKETYWTYLVTLAKPAIESDAPTPIDATNTTSPEFRIWAEDHNLSLQAASTLVMEELPHDLAPLAKTGDSRGVPLLRKALNSPNYFVSSLAAAGLAQANDTSSVPLIIAACKRLSPALAHLFAWPLLYFDDPVAQSTFASYNPGVNVSEARAFSGGVFVGIPQHSKQ